MPLLTCSPCPEGFVLRRLEPQHLDYVVSKWYHDMREKSMYLLSYFDHMIQHCETAAIFRADDPTKPVSWSMQYPYGQMGIGFTREEYRKKGLISIPCREISKKIIAGGDLPEGNTDNPTILKRDGFLDMYKTIWLEVKRTELWFNFSKRGNLHCMNCCFIIVCKACYIRYC